MRVIDCDRKINFLINYNNNRVLGVGLGSMLGEDAFLKYTGDLKIITCKVVTSENEMINLIPKLTRRDKFNCVRNDFDGENLKFEDLNKVGVVGKIPSKKTVNIITKNFNYDRCRAYKGFRSIRIKR